MNLEHKILQKIEQEGIHTRSRWFFYGKDGGKIAIALILIGISAVFCGISIALTVHLAKEISFANFPYSLVIFSIAAAFLAYESFVRSFSFYKTQISFGVAILCFITFSFGYTLFTFGHAERLERRFQHSPVYHKAVPHSFSERERFERRD